MKAFKIISLLLGVVGFSIHAHAQEFAPANLNSVLFNGTITSATGGANGSGTISSLFTANGIDYTVSASGAISDPVAYTYTRNSGTSATITEAATAGLPAVSVALTFNSATTGSFVATYANNSTQRGNFTLAPVNFSASFLNTSTRTVVAANGSALTGFVIGGTGPRRVLIRAVGPGLAPFNVPNTLANPQIMLWRGSTQIGGNDDYASGSNVDTSLPATFTRAGAFSLPANSRDAAMVATLEPGGYVAQIKGGTATESGEVLLEVYFLD